ncbi:hypothetical protein D3C71_2016740 [compost metagenome]
MILARLFLACPLTAVGLTGRANQASRLPSPEIFLTLTPFTEVTSPVGPTRVRGSAMHSTQENLRIQRGCT